MSLDIRFDATSAPGPTVADIIATCRAAGATRIVLHGAVVEGWLGRPVPVVPIDPPDQDGLSVGLLEIEEDVFRDSYELARGTFQAEILRWRSSVDLAPLGSCLAQLERARLEITSVDWQQVDLNTDADLTYACRVAVALGRAPLVVSASVFTPERTAAFEVTFGIRVATASLSALSEGV